jgi:hypothetical protein
MYIPHTSNLYGSDVLNIELSSDKSYDADVDISKTHIKALDQENERCEKTADKLDTSACIVQFVEEKIGCRFSFYKSKSLMSKCNTSSQYKLLYKLTDRLQSSHATEIYEMTGMEITNVSIILPFFSTFLLTSSGHHLNCPEISFNSGAIHQFV